MVKKTLESLDVNKAYGVNGISTFLLKILSNELYASLTLLFNISLFTGNIPIEWKFTNVSPIVKSGSKNHVKITDQFHCYVLFLNYLKGVCIIIFSSSKK